MTNLSIFNLKVHFILQVQYLILDYLINRKNHKTMVHPLHVDRDPIVIGLVICSTTLGGCYKFLNSRLHVTDCPFTYSMTHTDNRQR